MDFWRDDAAARRSPCAVSCLINIIGPAFCDLPAAPVSGLTAPTGGLADNGIWRREQRSIQACVPSTSYDDCRRARDVTIIDAPLAPDASLWPTSPGAQQADAEACLRRPAASTTYSRGHASAPRRSRAPPIAGSVSGGMIYFAHRHFDFA